MRVESSFVNFYGTVSEFSDDSWRPFIASNHESIAHMCHTCLHYWRQRKISLLQVFPAHSRNRDFVGELNGLIGESNTQTSAGFFVRVVRATHVVKASSFVHYAKYAIFWIARALFLVGSLLLVTRYTSISTIFLLVLVRCSSAFTEQTRGHNRLPTVHNKMDGSEEAPPVSSRDPKSHDIRERRSASFTDHQITHFSHSACKWFSLVAAVSRICLCLCDPAALLCFSTENFIQSNG